MVKKSGNGIFLLFTNQDYHSKEMNVQTVTTGANCKIDSTAMLENVKCGDNVVIGKFVELKNVVIGSGSKIGGHVVMYSPSEEKPIRIGSNTIVAHGTFAEATGGEITLMDNVSIAHRCTLLTSSDSPWSPELSNLFPLKSGGIQIDQHTWIGVGCTILPNVKLPKGFVAGAHSLIRSQEYKPWTMYGGSPCKEIKPIAMNPNNPLT